MIYFQLTLKVHVISSVYIKMYGTYKNNYTTLKYANQGQLFSGRMLKYADLRSTA